jgi:hypothetical protein
MPRGRGEEGAANPKGEEEIIERRASGGVWWVGGETATEDGRKCRSTRLDKDKEVVGVTPCVVQKRGGGREKKQNGGKSNPTTRGDVEKAGRGESNKGGVERKEEIETMRKKRKEIKRGAEGRRHEREEGSNKGGLVWI